ncbi:LuxR C-terminal-related transcriptional regulator [Streptomyces sp. WMMC500]|uniref:LuxR C-terminal-related transcriptional regulator n=1 Tax=Streptomyces sp. WMMC500 TaxID=3015154 RepID=UPI00248C868C|nr:LuxR family transcriptional regulator [Streptomyces sp. WMMC500]WBB60948.1 LuxR C-terminal-related transcriptional regulator [Streptomyces sp. WMMC500]
MAFVIRAAEFEALRSAFSRCLHGMSRTILIEGGVGCGKSALLHAITEHAADMGATILSVQGRSTAAHPPISLFQQLVAQVPAPAPGEVPTGATPALQFSAALPHVAENGAVVISVDDVQDIPWSELDFLLQTVSWHRSRRTLILLSHCPHLRHRDQPVKTELLRRPNAQRIHLGPLDERGVRAAVTTRVNRPHEQWIELLHHLSGGSPLLLRALLEDLRDEDMEARPTGAETSAELGMYGRAVVSCLYRSGATAVELGRLVSVLGDSAAPELLSGMTRVSPAVVDQQLEALRNSGILDGTNFRHGSAPREILADLGTLQRNELHRRAAMVQNSAGSPTTEVARHLLAARHAPEAWQRSALRDAAETAIGQENIRLAVRYLELALENSPNSPDRIEIYLRLALITQRISPAATEVRHLTALLSAFHADKMPSTAYDGLADLLFRYGKIQEAFEVLQRQGAESSAADVRAGDHPSIGWLWAWYSHQSARHEGEGQAPRLPPPDDGARSPYASASSLFQSFEGSFLHGERGDWAAAAENLLEVSTLSDSTVWSLSCAIKALVIADRLESAWQWCEWLIKESASRDAPGWQAIFSLQQAMIALRQGKLAASLECIRLVESVITERSTGYACAAEAVLAALHMEMGRYDEVARVFAKPVPPAWEKSVYWLSYLCVRGSFHLATNRPHSALADFLRIGKVAERTLVDHPTLAPWRLYVAQAWLHLGDEEMSARMLAEHTARAPCHGGRTHAMELRLRARLAPPHKRPGLLFRAVDELLATGDRLDQARTLHELATELRGLGHESWAGRAQAAAAHIARNCLPDHAMARTPLPERASRPVPDPASAAGPAGAAGGQKLLTRAEHRVAALVAKGMTNRQVAGRLHITVSTVEQHLTRIYQKLGIGQRADIGKRLKSLPA